MLYRLLVSLKTNVLIGALVDLTTNTNVHSEHSQNMLGQKLALILEYHLDQSYSRHPFWTRKEQAILIQLFILVCD